MKQRLMLLLAATGALLLGGCVYDEGYVGVDFDRGGYYGGSYGDDYYPGYYGGYAGNVG